MPSETVYVAFPSSEHLHHTTDGFIQRMRSGATRPEPEVVEEIMTRFLDEALETFFLAPSEMLGLGRAMKRIVHVTADTISRTSHMVVKRTAKKLDIQQNRDAAEYMDKMRMMHPDSQGNEIWYISFPISDAMARKARNAIELAEAGDLDQALPRLTDFLHELTDVALHWYFEEPMKLLGFGPVMKRIVSVAVETTRKATHSVIKRVFRHLEGEQIREAARYMDSLLVEGPYRADT